MDVPGLVKNSANLLNKHGRHWLICISKIDVNDVKYLTDRDFFMHSLWWIILVEFENQLIFIFKI